MNNFVQTRSGGDFLRICRHHAKGLLFVIAEETKGAPDESSRGE